MRAWTRLSTAVLVLCLVIGSARATDPEPDPDRAPATTQRVGRGAAFFDGTLDAALVEARGRNVPLVVFAVLEGEEENHRFREHFLGDPLLLDAAERAVLLVVNDGTHASLSVDLPGASADKATTTLCEAFEVPNCETHSRNWRAVYDRLVATDPTALRQNGEVQWKLPQALIVLPDATVVARISQGEPPRMDNIRTELDAAARQIGRGVGASLWSVVLRLRANAVVAREAEDWGGVWRANHDVLALIDVGAAAAAARIEAQDALAKMRAQLERGTEFLVGRFAETTYRRLRSHVGSWAGSPLERELAQTLRRAENDPDSGPALAPVKLELDAADLLARFETLLREAHKSRARQVLRRLLAEPFATTPAARTAREKYPELVR